MNGDGFRVTPIDLTSRICSGLERQSCVVLSLIVILLSGWAIRLYGLNWDQGHGVHPDERYITWVASSIRLPDALEDLFDPRQTSLNPFVWPLGKEAGPKIGTMQGGVVMDRARAFSYGHFPLYLMVLVSGADADEARLALVGRVLSALFDTATILLVFALGRLLYGAVVGILAAVFVTLTVMHVQQAHFATVDATLAFFVVATLLFAVRFARFDRWRDALVACLCLGLAVGTKFSGILLLAPLGVALMLRGETFGWRGRRTLAVALLGLCVAFVVFASTNPFSLIQAGEFANNLQQQGAMLRGDDAFPFTLQYRGTRPYLYLVEQQLRWGMGLPLGLVAFGGVAYALLRALRCPGSIETWILLTWVGVYFGFYGSLYVKFMRYMLPLSPVLAVLGAALLLGGVRCLGVPRADSSGLNRRSRVRVRVANFFSRTRAALRMGTIAVVFLASAFYTLAFLNVYRSDHPWLKFSRWLYHSVPTDATIVYESWDHHLPLTLLNEEATWWPGAFNHQSIDLYAPDTPEKLQGMLAQLAASDYLIMASNRLFGSTTRAPERYPLTVRYYELLFDGRLGYELVSAPDIERQLRLGPIALLDDPFQAAGLPSPPRDGPGPAAPLELILGRADESFTVYDHPRPMLFRNVARLSLEEMEQHFVDRSSEGVRLRREPFSGERKRCRKACVRTCG
jgi:hypothetical protein